MIINELMQGTRTFKVNADGTETFTDHPPTRKELKAAETIKQLIEANLSMQRVNDTLQADLNAANVAHLNLMQQLAKLEARCIELKKLIDSMNALSVITPVKIHQENFGVAPE